MIYVHGRCIHGMGLSEPCGQCNLLDELEAISADERAALAHVIGVTRITGVLASQGAGDSFAHATMLTDGDFLVSVMRGETTVLAGHLSPREARWLENAGMAK